MKYKKLSVIMSAYQRAHVIQPALYSLINQKIPPDEIIIIDDGSTDDLSHRVKYVQKSYPEINIRYFYNNNPGWTICVHGMNCAIKKASHEIIMTTMPEVLHLDNDVEIIKKFFQDQENKKVFCKGGELWELRGYRLLNSLTPEQLLNPILITELDCVNNWHKGLETKEDTITHHRTMLHHISGFLREDLVAVGGYDEGFLNGGAGGYDDIDLFSRLSWYGKEVILKGMRGIHLHHDAPPLGTKDPAIVYKNYNRMRERHKNWNETRDPRFWKVNIGKEWGVLKI